MQILSGRATAARKVAPIPARGEKMEKIELAVSKRNIVGKQVNSLRRAGIIPAILYGRHIPVPMLLQMEGRVFNRVLQRAGTSRLITLNVEGDQSQLALVRQVQREPISGNFYHVDFMAVSMSDKIRLSVPVVLIGASPLVERGEGIVLQAMDAIEIECLPGDLIESVQVDISQLDQVGKEILVSDLAKAAKGIEIMADPDELIVRITFMREEELEEAAPVAEVEVISKGKVEEEEE